MPCYFVHICTSPPSPPGAFLRNSFLLTRFCGASVANNMKNWKLGTFVMLRTPWHHDSKAGQSKSNLFLGSINKYGTMISWESKGTPPMPPPQDLIKGLLTIDFP